MKKVKNSKASPAIKKKADEGELKKPTKLKPLKEKEKKVWKNKLGDDDDDFMLEDDDLNLNNNFDEEEDYGDDDYYDDGY